MGQELWVGSGYYLGAGFSVLQRSQEAPASVACEALQLTGFTHEQLSSAFATVSAPWDWKGPIRAEITAPEQASVGAAVMWFTSTMPVFTPVPGRPDRLLVTAPGYRLGPARDAP